jgi:hypothetical protein
MTLCKKEHKEDLRDYYMNIILGNEIKADEGVGLVSYMGKRRNAYRRLVGKPEGRTWDDINKMDLIKYNWMAWTGFV